MPTEISGEKPDVERLYEAVNVLLYLQVRIHIIFSFLRVYNHVRFSSEVIDGCKLMYIVVCLQSPLSGGFAIWEPPVPQPYLQVLNPSELFADIVVEQE